MSVGTYAILITGVAFLEFVVLILLYVNYLNLRTQYEYLNSIEEEILKKEKERDRNTAKCLEKRIAELEERIRTLEKRWSENPVLIQSPPKRLNLSSGKTRRPLNITKKEEMEEVKRRVVELYRQGFSVREISRRTKMSVGEVEIFLGLFAK